ncbi:hypothetical protein CR513_57831, partial [Mucuna pruriens]
MRPKIENLWKRQIEQRLGGRNEELQHEIPTAEAPSQRSILFQTKPKLKTLTAKGTGILQCQRQVGPRPRTSQPRSTRTMP